MEAFPEGSLNNSLGGSGPLNPRPDHATFMGNNDGEAFRDFASSAVTKPYRYGEDGALFDPKSHGVIHGDESIGLGTTTFLAGTPAARTAIQRAEQEKAEEKIEGMQRKKSLAHRIRGINNRASHYGSSLIRSAESPVSAPISEERNPFDEFRPGDDGLVKVNATSSPGGDEDFSAQRRVERRATTESFEESNPKSGLISRMKSLKGSRKPSQGVPLPGPE
jgi:hypothetical protein